MIDLKHTVLGFIMSRIAREKLYFGSTPRVNFNAKILEWLKGETIFSDHAQPKTFSLMLEIFQSNVNGDPRIKLDGLTDFFRSCQSTMIDDLRVRHSESSGGGRSSLQQAVVKNGGENYMNLIVWILAEALKDRDDVLVDKGFPRPLRDALTLVHPAGDTEKVECDFAVFSRSDPTNAIIWNAKTRLRDVFKNEKLSAMLLETMKDSDAMAKKGFRQKNSLDLSRLDYAFITADLPNELDGKRFTNDHRVAASYFHRAYVTKPVSCVFHAYSSLGPTHAAAFHTASCIMDAIEMKFG